MWLKVESQERVYVCEHVNTADCRAGIIFNFLKITTLAAFPRRVRPVPASRSNGFFCSIPSTAQTCPFTLVLYLDHAFFQLFHHKFLMNIFFSLLREGKYTCFKPITSPSSLLTLSVVWNEFHSFWSFFQGLLHSYCPGTSHRSPLFHVSYVLVLSLLEYVLNKFSSNA